MSMGYGENILCGFDSNNPEVFQKEMEVKEVSIELGELPTPGQFLEFEVDGENYEIELDHGKIRSLQNDGFVVKFPHQGKILAVSVEWNP